MIPCKSGQIVRLGARVVFALVAFFGAAHCAARDVVVADLAPAPLDSDDDPDDETACTTNADCPSTQYCAKTTCDAPRGDCLHRPNVCADDGPAVCGCDGVSYWSDCVRAQRGVAGSTLGQCPGGVLCDSQTPCPSGATCARLIDTSAPCVSIATGKCWVLPTPCPVGLVASWQSCDAAPATCADRCAATQSGKSFRLAAAPVCN